MNIIILGPQGSGKGTQARLLAKKLNLFYFESGEFWRERARKDPRIDELINKRGQLMPDAEAFAATRDFLKENSPTLDNLLLDGYPRSVRQYEMLKGWLKRNGKKIDLAIYLAISDEEAVKRLSARVICEGCGEVYNFITNPPPAKCPCGGKPVQRPDDKPEAIRERLSKYHLVTAPLIEVFRKDGILVEVNGERPIETIFRELLGILKARNG